MVNSAIGLIIGRGLWGGFLGRGVFIFEVGPNLAAGVVLASSSKVAGGTCMLSLLF